MRHDSLQKVGPCHVCSCACNFGGQCSLAAVCGCWTDALDLTDEWEYSFSYLSSPWSMGSTMVHQNPMACLNPTNNQTHGQAHSPLGLARGCAQARSNAQCRHQNGPHRTPHLAAHCAWNEHVLPADERGHAIRSNSVRVVSTKQIII